MVINSESAFDGGYFKVGLVVLDSGLLEVIRY
jgi:hypothetical protein